MSKQVERQLTLDLSVRDDRKRSVTKEEVKCSNTGSVQIRSLSEARNAREREESARHFREILKLARHF